MHNDAIRRECHVFEGECLVGAQVAAAADLLRAMLDAMLA
jgi:hypothetical protein